MDILAELRKLLKMAEGNEPDDATANGIGEAEHIDAAPAETPQGDGTAEPTEPAADTPAADAPADADADAGAGVDNAAQEDADAAGETLPQSEVSEGELRDALNKLAAENETLRNRLAELAGDDALAALDPTEAALDAVKDDPAEDAEYDEDAAQADVDDQLAAIAALRG